MHGIIASHKVPKYSSFPLYDVCRDIRFAQITRLRGNLTQRGKRGRYDSVPARSGDCLQYAWLVFWSSLEWYWHRWAQGWSTHIPRMQPDLTEKCGRDRNRTITFLYLPRVLFIVPMSTYLNIIGLSGEANLHRIFYCFS